MTTDHNEAMRLADACKHGWLENVDPDKCSLDDLLALLRKQAAELKSARTETNRIIALLDAANDERKALRAEVERQTSALKVIYTWAGIPGALKPESVRELSGKALGKATP